MRDKGKFLINPSSHCVPLVICYVNRIAAILQLYRSNPHVNHCNKLLIHREFTFGLFNLFKKHPSCMSPISLYSNFQ